jgi:hypothetical protein
MQLSSSSVVRQVQQLFAVGNYPAAYQAILSDLNSQNVTRSGDDHSVLTWLADAAQINSGANTFASLAVRINNMVADQVVQGQSISVFGTQNQAASNAVAQTFLNGVVVNNGLIPNMNGIANQDATAGLANLGLGSKPGAWAGAIPDGMSFLSGINSSYYDSLPADQKQLADTIHVMDANVLAAYELASAMGMSTTERDAMLANLVATDASPVTSPLINGIGFSLYQGTTSTVSAAQSTWNTLSIAYTAFSSTLSSLQSSLNSLFSGSDTSPNSLLMAPDVTLTANSVTSGTITTTLNGITGVEIITQNNGQITDSISGQGSVDNLSNATLTLSPAAQAVIDGAGDGISLGANVSLTLGAGAVNDTVNVNAAGTSINMTGAGGKVAGDAITTQGTLENLSFGTGADEFVSIAQSAQTHITGTDGTLTTDTQGANNPFQNTINWNAGGSQNQVVNPGNGATLEFLNFTGANATGTDTQNVLDLTSGGSQQQLFTGLPTGDIEIVNYFTAPNDAGTLTSTTWNASAGGSVTEWFNPTSALSTEVGAYTGYNDAGSNLYNVLNYSAGGSQLQQLNPAALPAGVTLEDENFSGTGLTGTDTQNALNFSTNTSQLQLFTNLPTGDTEVVDDYAGLNLSGKLNNTIWDASNGTSVIQSYTPTSTVSSEASGYTGLNATGTDQYNVVNYTAGGSLYQQLTGLQSGVTESMEGFSGAGLTGTEKYTLTDYSNNSWLDLLAPSSGVNNDNQEFTGANATGTLTTAMIYNANNTSVTVTYDYLNNPGLTLENFFTGSTSDGSGVFSTTGHFLSGTNNGGAFTMDSGVLVGNVNEMNGGGGGDDGGYGFGGGYELASSAGKTTGTNIGIIAQFDTNAANAPAAAAAEAAQSEISLLSQLQSTGQASLAASPFYEDTKWSAKTVTWSLADMAGASGSPFSSYMGPQYAALVQKAFATWGAASGITFQEVADSSQSDIRIGWGDFSTSSSGVVGYTSYQYQNGQMQPNVIIRLEDPSKNSLVGASGVGSAMTPSSALTYSGTQANLYQVLMHEIGHALGLADNGDSNSVMYFQAQGASNSTLDGNDIAGMQALYGTGPSTLSFASDPSSQAAMNSTIQQMNQAVAFFHSEQSAASLFAPQSQLIVPSPLAVPQGTVV